MFGTTPTTVIHGHPLGSSGLPTWMRFPIALFPGHSHLAIDSLTITTAGLLMSSRDEKSRPAMIDVPSARIMSALATLYCAIGEMAPADNGGSSPSGVKTLAC